MLLKQIYDNRFGDYINQVKTARDWASTIISPLALAVFSKCPELVSDFINYLERNNQKLDLNRETLFGISLFDYAIITHDTKMFEVLIKETPKIHINKCEKLNLSHLVHHTICCGIPNMLDCLVEAGADLNYLYNGKGADMHGTTFWLTVKYDRKDMADYFINLDNKKLRNPIRWDQKDLYGRTALMSMAYTRYPEWAETLNRLISTVKHTDILEVDQDNQNILDLVLERIVDTCCKYVQNSSKNIFRFGYLSTGDRPDSIFARLCRDKIKMLKYLLKNEKVVKLENLYQDEIKIAAQNKSK